MAQTREAERKTMSTYLLKYEESLTAIIEKGGKQEDIDRAVKSYNHFHRSEFDTWLTDAELHCVNCEKVADKENVDPLDEITCKDHKEPKP